MIALLLSACGEEIVHDLAEAEANRVLSRLSREEIQAAKVVQPDGRWAISVPKHHASEALRLLDTRRVIAARSQEAPSFAKSGIVPSRDEQRFYYERALAAVLEETLQSMTGVLEAHVHLHLPHSDPLFREKSQDFAGSSAVLLLVDELFATSAEDVAALIGGAAGVPAKQVAVLKSVVAPRIVQPAQPTVPSPTVAAPLEPLQEPSAEGRAIEGDETGLLSMRRFDQAILLFGITAATGMLVRMGLRYRNRSRRGQELSLEYEA